MDAKSFAKSGAGALPTNSRMIAHMPHLQHNVHIVHVHVDLKFQSAPHRKSAIGTSKNFSVAGVFDVLRVQCFCDASPQRMSSIAITGI